MFSLSIEGYKLCQNLVFEELSKLQNEEKELNQRLKNSRTNRNSAETKTIQSEININNYKKRVFKLINYTIAWILFGEEKTYIDAFFIDAKGDKDLNSDSFKEVIKIANKINEDNSTFCFVTDLTDCFQVGDLIIFSPNKVEIKEVKIGKKNELALNLIKFYKVNQIELIEENIGRLDQKLAEQILRIERQEARRSRADNLLRDSEGQDTKSGNLFTFMPNPVFPNQTYYDIILKLIEDARKVGWGYTLLPGGLHIGVYEGDCLIMADFIMKKINEPYPIFNIMEGSGTIVCEPIFLKPFEKKTILDIICGRKKIILALNFDMFIAYCNQLGMKARWSTNKELQEMKETIQYKSNIFVEHENKGIVFEEENKKQNIAFLGWGAISRILFDHILPHSIIINRKNTFNLMREKYKDKI